MHGPQRGGGLHRAGGDQRYAGGHDAARGHRRDGERDDADGAVLQIRPVCKLRRVTQALPASFETVMTVTGTDPAGAVARSALVATTVWTNLARSGCWSSSTVISTR
ncbi:MAG: hypothetical protein OXG16_02475 [Rhodospirillales bacterium]|nr:hypothetical protein [Rhodospirillales bacterium]